jgi:hypothetical protein
MYSIYSTPLDLSTGISNLLQPAQAEVVLGQLSTYLASWIVLPQSTQGAGSVRFFIFCSISIFLPAGPMTGRRPVFCWCRLAGNILHHTYPLEYRICSSQPRQKSCWASYLRILPLGVLLCYCTIILIYILYYCTTVLLCTIVFCTYYCTTVCR